MLESLESFYIINRNITNKKEKVIKMSNYKIRRCWCGEPAFAWNGKYCLQHRPHTKLDHKNQAELNGNGLGALYGDKFFEAFDITFGLKPIEVK